MIREGGIADMPVVGIGRMVFWDGGGLWVLEAAGERGGADFHSHHAIQITIALEGRFELRTAGERLSAPAVAVAPDVRHLFEADAMVAFLFVEPESRAGRALLSSFEEGRQLRELPAAAVAPHLPALKAALRGGDDPDLICLGRDLVSLLSGSTHAAIPDRRVRAMIAHAAGSLEEGVSLGSAARAAGLSESRARHLFAAETGLPFKTFLLWLRIRRAVELYAAGQTLTEAAHEAGFADSAHFSRTFRRHFGLPAAALRVNSRVSRVAGAAGVPGSHAH
jgi:AraC-like DNA-binding protein